MSDEVSPRLQGPTAGVKEWESGEGGSISTGVQMSWRAQLLSSETLEW